MNRIDRVMLALAGITLALTLAATSSFPRTDAPPTLPQCEEDQTLVGTGDFTNGRWTAYACGPALDDFGGYTR